MRNIPGMGVRSIPACAGEPLGTGGARPAGQVYPRVCGGTLMCTLSLYTSGGLSPRVRGNPIFAAATATYPGSIPACAGEPLRNCCPSLQKAVYPRVCGGTSCASCRQLYSVGLSPRVRGNRGPAFRQPEFPRSIPACAGEPVKSRISQSARGVYPRVCGGTRLPAPNARAGEGLSPRVRGNPPACGGRGAAARSIPACAGEPRRWRAYWIPGPVYPRVCGGTAAMQDASKKYQGLSPRVRGNLSQPGGLVQSPGSIPACAGEPGSRGGS